MLIFASASRRVLLKRYHKYGVKGKRNMLSTIDDATLTKVATAMGEEEAVMLVDHLKNIDETTDDEIATTTGIRLNSVRKIQAL